MTDLHEFRGFSRMTSDKIPPTPVRENFAIRANSRNSRKPPSFAREVLASGWSLTFEQASITEDANEDFGHRSGVQRGKVHRPCAAQDQGGGRRLFFAGLGK